MNLGNVGEEGCTLSGGKYGCVNVGDKWSTKREKWKLES